MAVRELLAAIAGAADSDYFWIGPKRAVTLTSTVLGVAEVADIQIGHPQTEGAAVTWQDLWRDGTQQQLLIDNNAVTVLGPGMFRVSKGVTAAPTSVTIWT